MTLTGRDALSALSNTEAAVALFASDPHGFGGIVLRGPAGPLRDAVLAAIRSLLPAEAPWRRMPAGMAEDRLDGALDLAATLAAGRPVKDNGLLADSDGGVLVVPMAERLSPAVAARLGATLDTGKTADGTRRARFGLVALDEGIDDERLPAALTDRLAFHIDLEACGPFELGSVAIGRLPQDRPASGVELGDDQRQAVAAAAVAFGIDSLRPAVATLKAARACAALAGRAIATNDDISHAARLVLAPRATQLPAEPASTPPTAADPAQGEADPLQDHDGRDGPAAPPDDMVREAVRSALPPGLLLALEGGSRTARQVPGRAGALQTAKNRGRPTGLRRGVPRGGARLNLIETLRAAAPWQTLRQSAAPRACDTWRVEIRRDDLRLTRFKQRSETVTLFAVDASGSLALQRLAEAKGAVELLLAECYIRRDQVSLLAFRGTKAELLLPPTRSLARAKRCLADLAGGGATPLATALDAVMGLANDIRRRGRTATLVLFTDGRANVTRAGDVDRARAQAEAEEAARAVVGTGLRVILIDAALRPQPAARALATAMNATYLPLPRADAAVLTQAIRRATAV